MPTKTKKAPAERTNWFIANFPVDLRRRLIAKAKIEGKTTTQKVTEMVKEELKGRSHAKNPVR